MRRWVWIIAALLLIVAASWAWPFAGAAAIASAAQRRDSAEVVERVDVPALRRSLAKQISRAYLKVSGKGGKPDSFQGSLLGAAMTTIADPYLADLLTPENITALVGQGKLGRVKLGEREVSVDRDLPNFADLIRSDGLSILLGSYYDGIVSFAIPVQDPVRRADGDFTVHLRLGGLTWRLSGIDLPPPMVEQIARSILEGNGGAPAM